MKLALILLSCGLFLCFCFDRQKQEQEAAIILVPGRPLTDTIDFKASVQPLFEKNCSPCHFPGGKMYDKMPFDKSETIIHHSEGIFRRIKDEKELELLKQFLEQHRNDR
jgi:hypothetical protein